MLEKIWSTIAELLSCRHNVVISNTISKKILLRLKAESSFTATWLSADLPFLRLDSFFEFHSWVHLQQDDAQTPQIHSGCAARVALHTCLSQWVLQLSFRSPVSICLDILHILWLDRQTRKEPWCSMHRKPIIILEAHWA